MRIWFVTVGEPWPSDGENPRLLRTGINAGYFAEQGHDVLSWSGTFDHVAKRERTGQDVDLNISKGYRLIGLFAGTYQRNISFRRIAYHRAIAKRFREHAERLPVPDIIIVALTPLELSRAAVEYGRTHHVPVVVDVRDLWPDIWAEQLPGFMQPARHLLLAPFYNDLRQAVRNATAIIGITNSAVDWALASGRRTRGVLDRAFPLAYVTKPPPQDKVTAARRWWAEQGIGTARDELIGCFFGTLSSRVDLETPLRSLVEMGRGPDPRVKLVMCGRGEDEGLVRSYAQKSSQIACPGWVDAAQIRALMQLSSFGLLPYRPTLDFSRSLPNKVFEYLNGGLPIVTSLRGEIEKLIAEYDCGRFYQVGSPDSFQAIMLDFFASPDVLAKLSVGARNACAHYDPTSVCREFEAYVRTVAKRAVPSDVSS